MEKPVFSFIKLKHYCYTALALLLTFLILTKPSECFDYAANGLMLWFHRMIPTLFPFMVLSGVMIRMHLTNDFVKLLQPVLGPLFQMRAPCIYGVVIGFLCGFPMGAHTAAELYETGQITKEEASYLLSFCNNIGPVYFFSFVMPTLQLSHPAYFLMGMYGLPFLYGLFLRYTKYRSAFRAVCHKQNNCFKCSAAEHSLSPLPYISPALVSKKDDAQPSLSLLAAFDDSVFRGLSGIAKLGGYMIFFNLLFILPDLFLKSDAAKGVLCCLLEITGGIGIIKDRLPVLILMLLPFGGLSCIAQTYSMIKHTDLSITEYIMHKMLLTAITVCYYCLTAGKYF